MGTEIPGYADFTDEPSETEKPKKKSVKGGGFQSMGLSFDVLKGITRKGYKIPTPIQRKAIPLVLQGRDVVAMARTGSGKTACFLIPLFEKLKTRIAKTGTRALILSPTRELATQTQKFIKEIGRFTGLKSAVILGGDSMDDQFSAIHGNPDVIVATPGRFLHVCVEMELKLSSIEYIVFDEADRLYEMGFGEQLADIIARLPNNRQTLLFSATLPKVLVDFAKAGLNDPVLIRLDVESKLPKELQLRFLTVRPEERTAALLLLLKNFIDSKQQTIVFAATKHHVEYLHMIMDKANITNSYIYSNLDPSARKIHAAKFNSGKSKVLIVTDVAARGIDIPHLDNVINYNFPAKSKLFVHRVGRCARAGRTGTAYSLIGPDEYAYLLDLHLFLGKPLNMVCSKDKKIDLDAVGRLPQELIEEQHSVLVNWHETHADLASMLKVCDNGYQQYIKSRPAASTDSNKRIKTLLLKTFGLHPMFRGFNETEEKREDILSQMQNYRPQGTVFEIGAKRHSQDYLAMKTKRQFHKNNIFAHHRKIEQLQEEENELNEQKQTVNLPESNQEEISDTFKQVVLPKKRKLDDLYKKKFKKQKIFKDENYIPYAAQDKHTEEGLAVNSFSQEASRVQLDLIGDSAEQHKLSKQLKKWNRKKKKMVSINQDAKSKKIRTESGIWIPATYKSDRYAQWKEKTKQAENEESDDEDRNQNKIDLSQGMPNTHWARHNRNVKEKKQKSELKSSEQIVKQRIINEKKKKRNNKKSKKSKKKK